MKKFVKENWFKLVMIVLSIWFLSILTEISNSLGHLRDGVLKADVEEDPLNRLDKILP